MKVKVRMTIARGGRNTPETEPIHVEGLIAIDDWKLEGLTEDEVEAAVEILVRQWADERIAVEWEAEPDADEEK